MNNESKIGKMWNKLTDERDDTYWTKVKMGIAGLALGSFLLLGGYYHVKDKHAIRTIPEAGMIDSVYHAKKDSLDSVHYLEQKKYIKELNHIDSTYRVQLEEVIRNSQ